MLSVGKLFLPRWPLGLPEVKPRCCLDRTAGTVTNWVSVQQSKKRVNRAGNAIGQRRAAEDDIEVLENWRASHAYVLNTFQSNLRKRTRASDAVVGTRLKRRPTIENKLRRYPEMQLARMHDIAGCRIIFSSVEDLLDFRALFHRARFNHKRRGAEEEERWNYLTHPKPDGYRGIHEVYEYDVKSEGGKEWNGLNVEIQFRTYIQHAWSTAVEVAGLLTHDQPKFGQGSESLIEQFRIASEILARRYEGSTSCYPDTPLSTLVDTFQDCEYETRIIELFRRVNTKVVDIDFRKNNILVFPYVTPSDENSSELEIHSYKNVFTAIRHYNELEGELEDRADVVLVRADTFDNIRVTFRNYFADTTDFVHLLDDAIYGS